MPYDSGNECWKTQLLDKNGVPKGLLVLARKRYDSDGEEFWETFGDRSWPGKPRAQHFETLYRWKLSEGYLYFVLIHFGHEFTDDDYARELSLAGAISWLRAEKYELPDCLNGEASNVDVEAPTSGSDSPGPLTTARQEVWDLLKHEALLGKEIAARVCGSAVSEDSIRKRISAIRAAGRVIESRPGIGYYRPDAPPPDWTGADRESG